MTALLLVHLFSCVILIRVILKLDIEIYSCVDSTSGYEIKWNIFIVFVLKNVALVTLVLNTVLHIYFLLLCGCHHSGMLRKH